MSVLSAAGKRVARQQLLNDLMVTLGPISATLTPRALSDLYEAFLFGVVVAGARAVGFKTSYETVHGTSPASLVFRSSPGWLFSSARPYSHAVLAWEGTEWEVHLGVYVRGRSGVEHECDVLAIKRKAGVRARAVGRSPSQGNAILFLEAKYYFTPLPLHLGRGFLGLTDDIRRTGCFVSNVGSDSVARLLVNHRRRGYRDVIPASLTADRLRSFVEDFWDDEKYRQA